MAARPQGNRFVRRLYLVTPPVGDAAPFNDKLAAVLDTVDVAAVLLRLEAADERRLINHIKQLAPIVQDRNAALVLDGHPDLAARAGADGAHLTGIDAFNAAVATLKPTRIAGAGGLHTRHDAMLAGEAGADYVMFGEPGGHRPTFAAIEERVAWWAELFEPPCVGYAESLDEVGKLASAGADFVALGDWVWRESGGAAAVVAVAAERLMETVA
jgi:thiamine-phosphate pyrophosphorylase